MRPGWELQVFLVLNFLRWCHLNEHIGPGSTPKVTLPGKLRRLTFGEVFNQSMEGVILPCRLEDLVLEGFDQSLAVNLQENLQTLSLGSAQNWYGGFHKWGHPKMDGLSWKIQFK